MDEPATHQEERTLKEETLFSWRAPIRPFKARSSHFFWTAILVAILLSIIGFVIEGFMVVVLVWAVLFLVFVLSKVPPGETDYEITNKNIKIAGKKYALEEASRFWITERGGHKLLVFDIPFRFPGRLELVLSEVDIESLKDKLGKYVEYEEEPPEFADRAARWFSKKLSLD
ncbi:hypothetical protein HYZ78_02045 [Candidatus Microgenomates bacterium]|nr:hypothetical protein [Candidatus Microgenomates bacterium]